MEDSGGSTTIIYDVNLTTVETLLTEQNEHLQRLEGYTVSTVALLGLLVGVVLGAAVARLFYALWRV